jgi:hypothetical protein
MNDDMLEARRELLAERGTRDRFPLLSARPDWPPERRQPVPGLDPQELAEWRSFWHEVDRRAWGEELHPPRDNDERISLEARDPVRAGDIAKAVTEDALAKGHAREATLEDAMADWKVLHGAMVERMRADGHRTDDPLSDWSRVERSMRDFHATLTQLQVRDAQRRALDPVPDPDGRSISQSALEQAEDRMLAEHAMVDPPNSGAGRGAARAAVERQNAMEVNDRDAEAYRLAPQESRLDWLDAKPVSRREACGDDRLDWLDPAPSRQEREADRERERDR